MASSKRKVKKRILKRRYILLLLITAYIIYAFGSEYVKLRQLNTQYAALDAQKQALLVQQKFLNSQKKYMESYAFIELTARKELGFVKPGEHLILSAKPGEVKVLKEKPKPGEIGD